MSRTILRPRAGVTLVEVLIALTITSIIGAALTGVLVSQSRFYDQQEKLSNARQVSRSAINMLTAELRMVETSGGIAEASATSIKVNVPYAMGLVCGSYLGALRVSLLPTDSTVFTAGPPSGFAYRVAHLGSVGYEYRALPNQIPTLGSPAACFLTIPGSSVMPVAGGSERVLASSATPPAAVPMFLYREVTYSFGNSTSVPGRLALFRQVQAGDPEELVAPFDDGARFAFYVAGSQTPQAAAPGDLSTLRGIELVLTGLSERRPGSGAPHDRALLTTAVFFKNSQ